MNYFNRPSLDNSNPDLVLRLWRKKHSEKPFLYHSEFGFDVIYRNTQLGELSLIQNELDGVVYG